MRAKPGSANRHSEQGFTMVEVLVAVLLSVIAVIGVIALFMTETKAAAYSRRSSEATSLATDKLERLRTMATATTTGSPETSIDAQGASGGVFERSWTVTVGTSYTDLTVKVGWDDDSKQTVSASAISCSTDTACASKFCLSTGYCADRAIVVHGRRAN